ncbi:GAF domain-containing protein [Motilimonas cestriensis]|uniref:GAF domain-containing protein n=1 Tax=Motilimonas cestriensis TaxID=2742685 RepID=UPI003DA1D0B2
MNDSQANVFTFNVKADTGQDPLVQPHSQMTKRLSALYEISELGKTVLPLNQVFHAFHQALKKALYADNMLLALYNSERSHIHIPYFVDQADENSEFTGLIPAREFIESTLVGYIFRRKQAFLADSEKLQRLKESGAITFRGTQSESWLGLPLVFQDELLGVLVLQSYDPAKLYKNEDLEFLNYAGNQLSAVLGYQLAQTSHNAYVEQLEDLIDWQIDEIKHISKKAVKLEAFQKAETSPRAMKEKVTH